MYRIYMIESVPVIAKRFSKGLARMYEIRVCKHIECALEEIRMFQPDLLIVDMTDPKVHIHQIPQSVYWLGLRPKLIVSAPFVSGTLERRLHSIGCSALLPRPFTAEHLMQCTAEVFLEDDLTPEGRCRRAANDILLFLGIQVSLQGYSSLLEAIVYTAQHMDAMISCEIYPFVAKLHCSSYTQVERAIRQCVDKAWEDRDDRIWGMYFAKDRLGKVKHVSSGVFIKRIAYSVSQMQYPQDMQMAE